MYVSYRYSTNPQHMAIANDYINFLPKKDPKIPVEKQRTFDDLFAFFRNTTNPVAIQSIDVNSLSTDITGRLLIHLEKIREESSAASTQKVIEYINIICSMLNLSALPHLRRAALESLLYALDTGCKFHQVSAVRNVIIWLATQDPHLMKLTGVSTSIEFYFSVALQRYRQALISEIIQIYAPLHLEEVIKENDPFVLKFRGLEQMLLNGDLEVEFDDLIDEDFIGDPDDLSLFAEAIAEAEGLEPSEGIGFIMDRVGEQALTVELDSMGADIRKESAEMVYVVEKKLGFSKDQAPAHFYENTNIAELIANETLLRYEPEKFFLESLSDHYPNSCLRGLHAEIGNWYRQRALDPFERTNRGWLMDRRANPGELWFNEKAIHYCLRSVGILS